MIAILSHRRLGRLFYCLISVVVALAMPMKAADPQQTVVSDVVYRADGTTAKGTILISWPAFSTADGKPVAAGSMSVKIGAGGAVNIALIPTQGATPSGTAYKVTIALDDGSSSTEYWAVPALSPTTIAAIRATQVPATVAMQVVSRDYVDAQLATAVRKNGDETIGGEKTFESSPLVPPPGTETAAANKAYVDDAIAAAVPLAGNVLNINKGGTGTNAFTPSRCVRVTDDGSSLESAPADCGGGGSANADTLDGKHLAELRTGFDVRDYAGADAGAKINAAIAAAVTAGGGVVDARSLRGVQTISTCPIQVGTASAPVWLMFGHAAHFNIACSGGAKVFVVGDSSAITGEMGTTMLAGSPSGFFVNPGVTLDSVITNADQTGAQEAAYIDGLYIMAVDSTVTVNTAAIHLKKVYVPSRITNTTVYNFNGRAIWLESVGNTKLDHIESNGGGYPNAEPLVIDHGSGSIYIFGGTYEHAGPGKYNIRIEQVASDPGATQNVSIFGTYTEGSNSAGGMLIHNARNIEVHSYQCGGSFQDGSACVQLVQDIDSPPAVQSIIAENISGGIVSYGAAGAATYLVNDTIDGITYLGKQITTGGIISRLVFRGSETHYTSNDTIVGGATYAASSDANVPLVARWNSASQSGNMVQVEDNTGALQGWADKSGNWHAGFGLYYGAGGALMSLSNSGVNWQSSGGAALAAKAGSLVVSNSYSNDAPANGIYSLGQFKSGVATGTKPIDTTSTTLNDNLNADLVDGKHAADLVLSADKTGAGAKVPSIDASPTDGCAQLTGGKIVSTGSACGSGGNATPLGSGTAVSLTAPRQYYVCTGTCTVTPPVPAAGYEFCVMNGDNVSTVITFAALGSSAMYENTARTAYGTAGTGTLVSSGAAGDKVCLLGLDSTHYLTTTYTGSWTAN